MNNSKARMSDRGVVLGVIAMILILSGISGFILLVVYPYPIDPEGSTFRLLAVIAGIALFWGILTGMRAVQALLEAHAEYMVQLLKQIDESRESDDTT